MIFKPVLKNRFYLYFSFLFTILIMICISYFSTLYIEKNVKTKILEISTNDIFEIIEQQGYKVLSLNPSNCENLMKLPLVDNHKDPFDRMIISQAIEYDFTLISKDGKFNEYKNYGLKLL